MQNLRNIVVTGSNKGIGYGIVENLAQKTGWNIIMACRNVDLANKAREELLAKYKDAHIQVEQLDVTDKESIDKFVHTVAEKYKQIDVLLNNAGVAAKGDAFDEQVVRYTFATNFYGTINLTDSLQKYVSSSGKIIFVGSMVGKLSRLSEKLKEQFRNSNLSKAQLYELMSEFIEGVIHGNYAQKGWPKTAYGVSKIGINHFAKVLAKDDDIIKRGIQVYSLCPGYVDTDMTSHKGILTIQQGALTPVYLVELPFEVNPSLQGQFFERSGLSSLQ